MSVGWKTIVSCSARFSSSDWLFLQTLPLIFFAVCLCLLLLILVVVVDVLSWPGTRRSSSACTPPARPGPLVIAGVAGLERALPQAVDLGMLVQEGKACSCFLGLVLLVFVSVHVWLDEVVFVKDLNEHKVMRFQANSIHLYFHYLHCGSLPWTADLDLQGKLAADLQGKLAADLQAKGWRT